MVFIQYFSFGSPSVNGPGRKKLLDAKKAIGNPIIIAIITPAVASWTVRRIGFNVERRKLKESSGDKKPLRNSPIELREFIEKSRKGFELVRTKLAKIIVVRTIIQKNFIIEDLGLWGKEFIFKKCFLYICKFI